MPENIKDILNQTIQSADKLQAGGLPDEHIITYGLNPKQKEAVTSPDMAVVVTAGAGSGKTRVLTRRIAWLIVHDNIEPKHILAMTFTNKAAKEMQDRLATLIGEDRAKKVTIGTFHGICNRMLKQTINNLPGYQKTYTINDSDDSLKTLTDSMKKLGMPNQRKREMRATAGRISHLKAHLISPSKAIRTAKDHYEREVGYLYKQYQQDLQNSNCLDFDDLIYLAVKVLDEHPMVRHMMQKRFTHVLVDEYQDTNVAQYTFMRLLLDENDPKVFCVGDADQSIYGWRDAEVKIINGFTDEFDNSDEVVLDQNYRSRKYILRAANDVIGKAPDRHDKHLWTDNDEGNPVRYYEARNDDEQVHFVADTIKRLHAAGANYRDIAILYRMNRSAAKFEPEFTKDSIPYNIVKGQSLYDSKAIKDVMSYLKFILNPKNANDFSRIINIDHDSTRKIGKITVDKLIKNSENYDHDLLATCHDVDNQSNINGITARRIKTFADAEMMPIYRKLHANDAASRKDGQLTLLLMKMIDYAGYGDFFDGTLVDTTFFDRFDQDDPKVDMWKTYADNLSMLIQMAKTEEAANPHALLMQKLTKFLDDVTLNDPENTDKPIDNDIKNLQEDDDNETPDQVQMLTVHSAKGLEYDYVIIVDANSQTFPMNRDAKQFDEERRLMYVAITRAKKQCYFTLSTNFEVWGKEQYANASDFIADIKPEHLKIVSPTHSGLDMARNGYGIL